MPPLKSASRAQKAVQVRPLAEGYAVQIYGQTVIRSVCHRDALRIALELRRTLG